MKMTKMSCILSSIFYENEKQMKSNQKIKAMKNQSKNLLSMKIVVNYLIFAFQIDVKTKFKYKILNFVFQFIENTKWHFGYTDFFTILKNVFLPNLNRTSYLNAS